MKTNSGEYKVEYNYCDCHPETCCCNKWKVLDTEGQLVATFYEKEDALKLRDTLKILDMF